MSFDNSSIRNKAQVNLARRRHLQKHIARPRLMHGKPETAGADQHLAGMSD